MPSIANVLKIILLLFLLNEVFSPIHLLPSEILDNHFIQVFIRFLIYILIVNISLRATRRFYRRKKQLSDHSSDNVILGLKNIYYLFFAAGIFISLLSLFEVDFMTFFTSISIVAAALAIITREYIGDIISGIMLSFSSYFKPNDYVKIGEVSGKIIDITLSKVVLLSDDDNIIVIPNNKAFTSEIINHTRKASKKVSIEFDIDLLIFSTVEELEDALIRSLAEYTQYIDPVSYELRIEKIHAETLSLKFQYLLLRVDRKIEKEIRKNTVRRVVNFVKENAATLKNED